MDELYQVNVRLLWNHFPQTEPTMDMIRHASRTRSDSNSFTIDNSEFDRDVLGLLDNNQHALICFASLYEDFKYSSVCCVYEGWEISVWTSLVTESKPCVFHRHHVAFWNLSNWTVLLNAIQTSSHSLNPQRRQAGVESSKEMRRKRRIERNMNRYLIEYPETQDLKEQYTMLETQLREIDSVAEDHQQGLSPDHDIFKALKRIRKGCRATLHEMKRVMRDEECGYTVNRLDELVVSTCNQ